MRSELVTGQCSKLDEPCFKLATLIYTRRSAESACKQSSIDFGMGDLQTKLLTVAEAKKRKADIVLQSRLSAHA